MISEAYMNMDIMDENMIPPDTDKLYCRILLDTIMAQGVNHIFLSPGSRNAPILIGASARSALKKHIVTDERNAAFMALGMGMVTGDPVALACTSGTALYNYAPAIAEAYYQKIPLIVITADRPFEWIGQDDSQTLVQPDAFRNIVKKSFDIPVETDSSDTKWYVERICNEAMLTACGNIPGPVHINIHFENPLSNTVSHLDITPHTFKSISADSKLKIDILARLAEKIADSKILVTAGFMRPDNELNKILSEFSKLPNVRVMAETISNLHLSTGNVYSIDTILCGLSEEEKEKLRPDIVISIGGALVSRMLKNYIRSYKPIEVWTLGDTDMSVDCFKALSVHFDINPASFFKGLNVAVRKLLRKGKSLVHSSYADNWNRVGIREAEKHRKYVNDIGWSELKAFGYMLDALPRDYNLFLSNGTSVRYAQLFTESVPHASFGCRGVSGIEGTTAAAAGAAMAYCGKTLLFTGDMSFAYSPGVMGYPELPDDFKICVINNNGGGIFRFIDTTRNLKQREEFFCADPKVPVKGLAKAYGWEYSHASSMAELEKLFSSFLNHPSKSVLEISAPAEYSAQVLKNYFKI